MKPAFVAFFLFLSDMAPLAGASAAAEAAAGACEELSLMQLGVRGEAALSAEYLAQLLRGEKKLKDLPTWVQGSFDAMTESMALSGGQLCMNFGGASGGPAPAPATATPTPPPTPAPTPVPTAEPTAPFVGTSLFTDACLDCTSSCCPCMGDITGTEYFYEASERGFYAGPTCGCSDCAMPSSWNTGIAQADSCITGHGGGTCMGGPNFASQGVGPMNHVTVLTSEQPGVCLVMKAQKDIRVRYRLEGVDVSSSSGATYTTEVAGFVTTYDASNTAYPRYNQVVMNGVGTVGSPKQIGVASNWNPSEEDTVTVPTDSYLGLCGMDPTKPDRLPSIGGGWGSNRPLVKITVFEVADA